LELRLVRPLDQPDSSKILTTGPLLTQGIASEIFALLKRRSAQIFGNVEQTASKSIKWIRTSWISLTVNSIFSGVGIYRNSVAPLFTFAEYRQVTKPDGLVYVELPAPDISACHENNPNHYSVFPPSLGSLCLSAWDLRWSAILPSTSR
jgi:hypothetical protein